MGTPFNLVGQLPSSTVHLNVSNNATQRYVRAKTPPRNNKVCFRKNPASSQFFGSEDDSVFLDMPDPMLSPIESTEEKRRLYSYMGAPQSKFRRQEAFDLSSPPGFPRPPYAEKFVFPTPPPPPRENPNVPFAPMYPQKYMQTFDQNAPISPVSPQYTQPMTPPAAKGRYQQSPSVRGPDDSQTEESPGFRPILSYTTSTPVRKNQTGFYGEDDSRISPLTPFGNRSRFDSDMDASPSSSGKFKRCDSSVAKCLFCPNKR